MSPTQKTAAKKPASQRTLEAALWEAANKLRDKMVAAQCKHVILDLIFLKSRFRSGDVVYGKLRPFRKYDRSGFDSVCTTEVWILRPRDGSGGATLNAIVARSEFTDLAMAGSGGTKVSRSNLGPAGRVAVCVSPESRRSEVNDQLESLRRARVGLADEIAELTRDELLPLPMPGAIRVTPSFEVA